MIRVYLTENSLTVSGHAGYDEKGKDIVCADVSAIMKTAQMGLIQIAKQYPEYVKIMEVEGEWTNNEDLK